MLGLEALQWTLKKNVVYNVTGWICLQICLSSGQTSERCQLGVRLPLIEATHVGFYLKQ